MGAVRTEVRSARCGSHLGYVFPDGFGTPTGDRYSMNSVSLDFQPEPEAQHLTLQRSASRWRGTWAYPIEQLRQLSGRLRATQWRAGDLVGDDAKALGANRRMNAGGKKRSSVHSTNRVGTSGQASSGHGLL